MESSKSYENFYEGSVSVFSPNYGNFIGYRMKASQIGFPSSPQTANQLGETINALKQGVKSFEISMINPDIAEAVPKQHIKEIKALMKLSGVKPSVHGPIIDAAGFGEKGWSEISREDNERRIFQVLERVKEIDSSGNLPVVLHSSNGLPGPEFIPGDEKKGDERFKVEKTFAVNRETGQVVPIEREFKFRPLKSDTLMGEGGKWGKGLEYTPNMGLESLNLSEWSNKLTEILTFTKQADELIDSSLPKLKEAIEKGKGINELSNADEVISYERLKRADVFLQDAEIKFNNAFHMAFKYGDEETRKELYNLSKEYTQEYKKVINELKNAENSSKSFLFPEMKRRVLENALFKFSEITERKTPKIYEEVREFGLENASKTFSNLAIKSYENWGKSAPIIAIENMYQGMAFSTSEDLKKLVDKSRERFIDYLVGNKGLSRSEAERIAKEKIGVAWDVGHLNMMKKKGFSDKDVIEETKKIKDYVKHLHITDNFGFGDSHLAPGMGNVPLKEILKELEKNGEFDKIRKIVEAGGVVQHFKKSPHPYVLSAFGSPIYSAKMGPYWNQVSDFYGSYFGGYGTINPQQHHNLYGSGFTTLPRELGGQIYEGNSRFDGRPMA